MTQDPDLQTSEGGQGGPAEADRLRAMERERLRALVEADLEVAHRLHADYFQLIKPAGEVFSKEQYLGMVASGEIDYLVWEPDSPMEVLLYGPVAIMRYRSQLDIVRGGRHAGLRRYWHTDSYEQHDGVWQIVWSHATEIQ